VSHGLGRSEYACKAGAPLLNLQRRRRSNNRHNGSMQIVAF
jgi:hypothetical protein